MRGNKHSDVALFYKNLSERKGYFDSSSGNVPLKLSQGFSYIYNSTVSSCHAVESYCLSTLMNSGFFNLNSIVIKRLVFDRRSKSCRLALCLR